MGAWAIKNGVLESKIAAIRGGLIVAKPVADMDENPLDRVQIIELDDAKYGAKPRTLAIIRVDDVMMRHRSKFGGVSTVEIRRRIRACVDSGDWGICLHINSPGGHIEGQQELLDEVRHARTAGVKMYAYVSDMACSAAYWLAACCESVYSSRMAVVANIGAYAVLLDSSKNYEMEGLKVVVVRSGENKGLGVPGTPVDDKVIAQAQHEIDQYAKFFIEDVKAHRPKWKGDYADGSCLFPEKAIEIGLLDGVDTFEGFLERIGANSTEVFMVEGNSSPESTKEVVEVAGEKYDPTEVDTTVGSLDDLAEPDAGLEAIGQVAEMSEELAEVQAENEFLKTAMEDMIVEQEAETLEVALNSRNELLLKLASRAGIKVEAGRSMDELEKQLENLLKFGTQRPKTQGGAVGAKTSAAEVLKEYKERFGAIDGGVKFAQEKPELLSELYRERA